MIPIVREAIRSHFSSIDPKGSQFAASRYTFNVRKVREDYTGVTVDVQFLPNVSNQGSEVPLDPSSALYEYKATGNIEVQKLYNEQFQALIAAQSPGGNSLYDAIFPITVQYQLRTPPGIPQAPVVTDTLNGCRLAGQGIDLSAGNGVLTVKYPLYIAVIFWNGRQPLAGLTQ